MDWFLFALGLALMAAGPGLLILVWVKRRRPMWAVLAATATVAGGVWWIELYRAMTGAGDLDGMFDCYPSCSRSQKAAGVILFYVPVAMGGLLVGLLVATSTARVAGSRGLLPPSALGVVLAHWWSLRVFRSALRHLGRSRGLTDLAELARRQYSRRGE
jgi:hypothetical protein